MCLTDVKRGETVTIISIDDDQVRTQFIRFGIGEGSSVRCLEKIPFGPFMLRHNRQEIAVGREVAEKIQVRGGIPA
ncbi:MAG: ferrous iron transport protein A [Thermodesulfobacteriota bacterium]